MPKSDTRPSPAQPPHLRADSNDKVVLTFIGSVYGSTDPATLIDAVLKFFASSPSLTAPSAFYMGHIETDAYRESLLRLGDTVELKGFRPSGRSAEVD